MTKLKFEHSLILPIESIDSFFEPVFINRNNALKIEEG